MGMSNRRTTSRSQMIHVRVPLADYRRLVASGEPLSSQVVAAIRMLLDADQWVVERAKLVERAQLPAPVANGRPEVGKQGISDTLAEIAFGLKPETLMRDRRQAAVDLARLHGWMVDRSQVRVITGPEDLSDEELDNLIGGIRRRIAERQGG
jgi:hypothetical protein